MMAILFFFDLRLIKYFASLYFTFLFLIILVLLKFYNDLGSRRNLFHNCLARSDGRQSLVGNHLFFNFQILLKETL